ncbi:diguanylate cyclase domain-containing protein [Paraburkholderia fungorum]|uniref:diguanylate cyclase domain-containing protein n=1 Tax=Paraburkholderia fungorum TaxID=134537 RepID=UPI00209687E7|nr:diguanylate cyclase [Paraburkholderia fungorum]USX11205.1 diguanylate cyclase [Paraburkholderia fungorum]
MDLHEHEAITLFRATFETLSPRWQLSHDSNALELSPITGPVAAAVALSAEQAAQIRALSGVTSSVTVDALLFEKKFRLHLVGRKVDRTRWAGTASPSINAEAVAGDLARGLSFAETILSEVNSLVVILNRDGAIQRFNRLAEEISGLKEADVIGKNAWDLFMSHEDGSESRQNIEGFFRRGEAYEVERTVKTIKGPRLFLFRNKFARTGDRPDDTFLICSGVDITEERQARDRLAELANTDMLTGLRNRNYLMDRLGALTMTPESVGRLSLLFIDLDNFKRINDSLGHRDGDQLLKQVAKRLQRVACGEQEVMRVSGDEFVIVISSDFARFAAQEFANRVVEDFELAYVLRANSYRMRASIGVVEHVKHGDSAFDLLTRADLAMYAAKAVGKSKDISACHVYTPELSERAERGLQFYQTLQYGFLRKEFSLDYRDCYTVDGTARGLLAAVQWNRRDAASIEGRELISMIESSGFGVQLGEFQLTEACRQMREWRAAGQSVQHVTLNVPYAQLVDGDLTGCVSECLREHALEPSALRLIVQHRLDQAASHILDKLKTIRSTGVQILAALTPDSVFPNLTKLPVDGLCIDEELVERVPSEPVSRALIKGIVGVCGDMELSVLVHGVDSQEQFKWLTQFPGAEVQGRFVTDAFSATNSSM